MATPNKTQKNVEELEEFFRLQQLGTAPAWRPEPNTTIAVEVVGLRMGNSGYGAYPIVIYKKDDGDVIAVHAFHTLLRERLAELETEIGKRQYLTYLGKREKNNATEEEKQQGRDTYHMYFVMNADDVSSGLGVDENFTF